MKKIKKHYLALAAFFILFGVLIFLLQTFYYRPVTFVSAPGLSYEKAKVLSVTQESLEKDANSTSGYRGIQELEVKILTGASKGTVVHATNHITRTLNILAKEGSTLIVAIDESGVKSHVSVYNYARAPVIYLMMGLFLALLVIVGEWKGLKSAIGLIFTFVCLLLFTLPMIISGASPVLISIISIILIAAVTLVLIDGITKKTAIALIGTAAGVLIAGLVFILFSAVLHVSGFNMDDAETLLLISNNTGLKLKNVLFAGILIASLGAVIDVAMSVASTLHEIHERNPELPSTELFKSGLNVGKDMIGTMSNTLLLAYTGGSFGLLILLYAYSINYHQVINMDALVLEIMQGIAGSMGIIITVPIVAFLGARVYKPSVSIADAAAEVSE